MRTYPWYAFCADGRCGERTAKTPFRRAALAETQTTPPRAIADTTKDVFGPLSTIYFDYASAELTADARSALDRALPSFRGRRLRVTGYTDATQEANGRVSNHELARQRALVVKHHLVGGGFPAPSILIEAKALCCYIADNDSESGRRLNRRATITLLP